MHEHSLEKSNDRPQLAALYRELLTVVRETYESKLIDSGRIIGLINRLAQVFDDRLYNELLIYSYTVSKGNYIVAHMANNVVLSLGFAKSLGLSKEDVRDVGLVAFGHDFGMIEYTDLYQKAVQLTPEEREMIRQHPYKSAELFKPHFAEKIIAGILDMHEHVNGSGYPQGKTEADISPMAKIVSICDAFEAWSHPRQFRRELTPYEAMKAIIRKKDAVFDKRVVKKFVEFMSIYPIGQLVYLNTGETGLVIAGHPGFPTRSVVRVLLNPKREVEHTEKIVNLLNDPMIYISGPVKEIEEKEILQFLKPRGEFDV